MNTINTMQRMNNLSFVATRELNTKDFMSIDELNGVTEYGNDRKITEFHVYERPLFFTDKFGEHQQSTHKALVRNDVKTGNLIQLATVAKTYQTVQNYELYENIHDQLVSALPSYALQSCLVRDKVAGFGATTFREYVFPQVAEHTSENNRVAFRIVVQNGFGTSALKIHIGAIDFFCTNGMVIGEHLRSYAKHSKGLKVADFTKIISKGVDQFWKHTATIEQMKSKIIPVGDVRNGTIYQQIEKYVSSPRLAEKIFGQFLHEIQSRGCNYWALYSAFTVYSSYATGQFETRATGTDHTAATLMKREQELGKLLNDRNGLFMPALAA